MGREMNWLAGFDGGWDGKEIASVARFLRDLRAHLPVGWLAGVRRDVDVVSAASCGGGLAGLGGIEGALCLTSQYRELTGVSLAQLGERDADLADWEQAVAELSQRRTVARSTWTTRGLRRGLAEFAHAICAGATAARERFWRLPAVSQAFADWSPIPLWRVGENYERLERVVFACMWDGTGVLERGGLVAEDFARRYSASLRVAYVLERRTRCLGRAAQVTLPFSGDEASGATYANARELADDLRPTDLLVVARPANWWRRWTDSSLWREALATPAVTLLVLPPNTYLSFDCLGGR